MTESALQPSKHRDEALRARRARDVALVLPLAGVVLLAPPVANLFLTDVTLFGAPLVVIYLFTVWGALIVCAQRLSRRLRRSDGS
jgi:hypothetical protein